jgi:hypothetical protein
MDVALFRKTLWTVKFKFPIVFPYHEIFFIKIKGLGGPQVLVHLDSKLEA